MGTCPNCGAYISPGTNVCSCGTTFADYSSENDEKIELTEFERLQEEKRKIRQGYYQKAKALMEDGKYLDAVDWIDKLIEVDGSGFYLMAKAKAYYYAGLYAKALPLFRKSLSMHRVIDDYVYSAGLGIL